MNEIVVFTGLLLLQVLFAHVDRVVPSKVEQVKGIRHCGFLVWLLHPHMLQSFHDFGIFAVSGLVHG